MNSLDEHLYEFDSLGLTVFRSALTESEINDLLSDWKYRYNERTLFDISFTHGGGWTSLIDHRSYFPLIERLFHGKPRLDHAFGVTERFNSSNGRLHHHSGLFDQGIFHAEKGGNLYVGLIGVSIALTTISEGNGGFCYIPGSHKSIISKPEWIEMPSDSRLVLQVPQNAGDVIVFSEALTHGTFPMHGHQSRRTIIMRFVPGHMAFRKPRVSLDEGLPLTPNYDHEINEGLIDRSVLSERQIAIASLRPFSRGRESAA